MTPLTRVRSAARAVAVAACCAGAQPSTLAGQSITGTLLDLGNDRPIPLGLVMMFTESGDSVTATVADGGGRFRISSPEPGSFLLLAAALGYAETPAGLFELGDGGSMEVEYRLRPEPLPLEEIIVALDRPATEHHLVRNGFVRRLQRGLGRFITPYEIERSSARSTEALLTGISGVRVGMVTEVSPAAGDIRLGLPRPDLGETVQIAGPLGGWCEPTLYVDGVWIEYLPALGQTLTQFAHIGDVEAVEVYRRPVEIPVEYGIHSDRNCGVLVVWTKLGLAAGQRPSRAGSSVTVGVPLPHLPIATGEAVELEEGESIRMELAVDVAEPRGLESPWQGTFLTVSDGDLVASDPVLGRAISVPLDGVRVLHVEKPRGSGDAYLRGAAAGTVFATGMYGMLRILCRSVCTATSPSALLPSLATGLVVGVAVRLRGPGLHWVAAPIPRAAGGARGESAGGGLTMRGATLSVIIPTRRP
jgi:hypothetical protein